METSKNQTPLPKTLNAQYLTLGHSHDLILDTVQHLGLTTHNIQRLNLRPSLVQLGRVSAHSSGHVIKSVFQSIHCQNP